METSIEKDTESGEIREEMPKIKERLATFDPIIFPITISPSFLLAAAIETESSGREVPIATNDKPMSSFDMCRACAILIAESTNNCAPTTIAAPLRNTSKTSPNNDSSN